MHRPPHYPLRDWEQIEDPAEVATVHARLASLPRLHVYDAPDLYDLAYPGFLGDDAFYRPIAATGRVLYLGVGTGRLFAAIARDNPRAVGLDYSPEMLDMLRRRHPHVPPEQLVLADATAPDTFDPESFDAVIAPYCFLEVVDRDLARRVVANVARWLVPGGRFVTDAFSAFLIPFRRPGLETIEFPCEGHRISIHIAYDHVAQAMHESTAIASGEKEWVTDMTLHYLFPDEVCDLLRHGGLTVAGVTGEYGPERFDPSRHDVVVYDARKPV